MTWPSDGLATHFINMFDTLRDHRATLFHITDITKIFHQCSAHSSQGALEDLDEVIAYAFDAC